jgi:hypothetical protein
MPRTEKYRVEKGTQELHDIDGLPHKKGSHRKRLEYIYGLKG